jgi:hypothetical protein
MNPEMSVAELLRWRLAQAEAEAPPPPRARRLLEAARPWWEVWPERFRAQVERLGRMHTGYAYAMGEPVRGRAGHPVPTLIAEAEELETFARVLYLALRDGRLHLRFQLDSLPGKREDVFEVTFVSDAAARPLLSAQAMASLDTEYSLEADVSDELAASWQELKVSDRMPFRFILRPVARRR